MKAHVDVNYLSYGDQHDICIADLKIQPTENPGQYDDILKISHCISGSVVGCTINPEGGNREDGIDVMRESSGILFDACRVGAGDKYAITIKGGSKSIFLHDLEITRHGGGWEQVDIDIGNWSTTTPKKTGHVFIENVTSSDGKPVRVRVGWAERPMIMGGNVKVLFWQSLGLKVYCLLMRFIGLFIK